MFHQHNDQSQYFLLKRFIISVLIFFATFVSISCSKSDNPTSVTTPTAQDPFGVLEIITNTTEIEMMLYLGAIQIYRERANTFLIDSLLPGTYLVKFNSKDYFADSLYVQIGAGVRTKKTIAFEEKKIVDYHITLKLIKNFDNSSEGLSLSTGQVLNLLNGVDSADVYLKALDTTKNFLYSASVFNSSYRTTFFKKLPTTPNPNDPVFIPPFDSTWTQNISTNYVDRNLCFYTKEGHYAIINSVFVGYSNNVRNWQISYSYNLIKGQKRIR